MSEKLSLAALKANEQYYEALALKHQALSNKYQAKANALSMKSFRASSPIGPVIFQRHDETPSEIEHKNKVIRETRDLIYRKTTHPLEEWEKQLDEKRKAYHD